MSDGEWGIYVQEGQALAALLAGEVRKAEGIMALLSEGHLEALTDAAGELADMAERVFDKRLDVRPLTDPEAGLTEYLASEGYGEATD